MKPRQAFSLSIIAALSLHAVILVVPRIPGRRDLGPPTIELVLESVQGAGAGLAAEEAGAMRASAAVRPAVPAPADERPQKDSPRAVGDASVPETQSPAPAAAGDAGGAEIPAAASAAAGSGMEVSVGNGVRGGGPGGGAVASAGAQPGAASSATLAPRPRSEILPAYPRSARRAGWEGVVTIRAFIDETGKVVSAVVDASSGHQSLDQAALEAVKSTLFDPAVREARPVSSPLLIPVRFQLN